MVKKKSEMADDWTQEQVEAAVADYFDMLAKQLAGIPYNKAAHNRGLQKTTGRLRGSIEFKHRNITAVLIELGFPNIPGYKPLYNYQDLLRVIVEKRLAATKQLQKIALDTVEKPVVTPPTVKDVMSILVKPPFRDEQDSVFKKPQVSRKLPKRNYLEIEAHNRSLGFEGEKLVIEYEQQRLWRAGKKKLSGRVEHVANTQGDYLGFDIMSFEINGRERAIEVKTTRFGAWTPFFASSNEVKVSEFRSDHYYLYRLFNFTKYPKMFMLGGSLCHSCKLEPVQFSALPKSQG